MGASSWWRRRARRRSPFERARRPTRTLRQVVGRRQISTVYYLRKRGGEVVPAHWCTLPFIHRERRMPSESDAHGQAPRDLSDSAVRAQLERILTSAVF